jgi:hypothetical protein
VLFSELCGSLPKACIRFHPLQKLIPTKARWDSLRDILSYRDLVISFTKRDFTYDADILRAFAGISAFLENKMKPKRMIYGLPSTDLVLALSWVPQGLSARRYKCTSMDGVGISWLPSWSWAGWRGRKSWLPPFGFRMDCLNPGTHHVDVKDIEIVSFNEDLVGYCLPKDTATAYMLRFSAICLPTLQFFASEYRSGPPKMSHSNNAAESYDLPLPVQKIEVVSTKEIGLVFGVEMEQLQNRGTFLIQLGHWTSDAYEQCDENDYAFVSYPKPFDDIKAHGRLLGISGASHEYLVARWINDDHTVCERIGFAKFEMQVMDCRSIGAENRLLYLV